MRNRRDPRQRARLRRRDEAYFAGPRRDIDLGAVAVVYVEFVERHVATGLQRPLIGTLDGALERDLARGRSYEFRGDAAGGLDVDLVERRAGIGEHGGGAVRAREPIRGAIEHRRQHDTAETARRFRRGLGGCVAHRREIERGKMLEPRLCAQRRHSADIDHGDAGDEPKHEQHAHRNAEVTVREDQCAAQRLHEVARARASAV